MNIEYHNVSTDSLALYYARAKATLEFLLATPPIRDVSSMAPTEAAVLIGFDRAKSPAITLFEGKGMSDEAVALNAMIILAGNLSGLTADPELQQMMRTIVGALRGHRLSVVDQP